MRLATITIELTERCNNNCLHCYIRRPASDRQALMAELPTDKIKNILNEAADLGCASVKFSGGEPFLRRDFEEIYVYARRLGLRVIILTNATLVNTRIAKLFVYIRPLEKIEVTLYGMTRDSYELVSRSAGSYAAAREGIRLLQRYKIPFLVKGTLLAPTRGEVNKLESWARRLLGENTPVTHTVFFYLHSRRNFAKNMELKRLRLSPEEYVAFLTRDRKAYLDGMKEFCAKFTYPTGNRVFTCGAGAAEACVDAYGFLQPCMLVRHPDAVYDITKGTLREAFGSFFPALRAIKAKNQEYLKRCARCFLKGLCKQCPARSWMEHGTMDTPVEYCCSLAHFQAEDLGLLRTGERAWQIKDWRARLRSFTGKEIHA